MQSSTKTETLIVTTVRNGKTTKVTKKQHAKTEVSPDGTVRKCSEQTEQTEVFGCKKQPRAQLGWAPPPPPAMKLKTALCSHFAASGACPFGTGCKFAHACELATPAPTPRGKGGKGKGKAQCKFGQGCKRRHTCTFLHPSGKGKGGKGGPVKGKGKGEGKGEGKGKGKNRHSNVGHRGGRGPVPVVFGMPVVEQAGWTALDQRDIPT